MLCMCEHTYIQRQHAKHMSLLANLVSQSTKITWTPHKINRFSQQDTITISFAAFCVSP